MNERERDASNGKRIPWNGRRRKGRQEFLNSSKTKDIISFKRMKEEKAMRRADSNQTENEKSSSFAFAENRKVYPEWEIFSQFWLEFNLVSSDVAVNAGIREKIWSRKSARTMQVRLYCFSKLPPFHILWAYSFLFESSNWSHDGIRMNQEMSFARFHDVVSDQGLSCSCFVPLRGSTWDLCSRSHSAVPPPQWIWLSGSLNLENQMGNLWSHSNPEKRSQNSSKSFNDGCKGSFPSLIYFFPPLLYAHFAPDSDRLRQEFMILEETSTPLRGVAVLNSSDSHSFLTAPWVHWSLLYRRMSQKQAQVLDFSCRGPLMPIPNPLLNGPYSLANIYLSLTWSIFPTSYSQRETS